MAPPSSSTPGVPALTQNDAARVLRRNVQNLVEKVGRGRVLNLQELETVEALAEGRSPNPNEVAFVRNQTALADLLGVSRRSIHRWIREGAPAPRSDGRLDVRAWRKWIAANAKAVGDSEGEDEAEATVVGERKRWLQLKCEQLTHEIASLRSEYTSNVEIEQQAEQLREEVSRVLTAIPDALAPRIVGCTVPEAAKRIRDAVDAALLELHTNLGQEAPTPPPG